MTKMKKIPGVVAVMLILSITIVHADNHDKAPLSGKEAPEPEAYVFLAIGTLGLVAAYRRRKP